MNVWKNFLKFDLFWCLAIAMVAYTAAGILLAAEVIHPLVALLIVLVGIGFQVYARWRWPPEHDRRYHVRDSR